MTPHRLTIAAICAAAGVLLSSCGGSGSTSPIEAGLRSQLRQDLQVLSSAAAAHNIPSAHAALVTLTADVAAAQSAGLLSATEVAQIRAAAASVNADLTGMTPTPVPSVTPTPTPTPPPGKDKHGKGGDNGGGDGGGD